MNPERAAIHSLDNRKRIDDIAETAELLLPLHGNITAAMEKVAVQPSDFEGFYDKEGLVADQKYVTRMKQRFAAEAHEPFGNGLSKGDVRNLAEVLEYLVYKGINIGRWLPYVSAIKTAELDDIKNGVDLVLAYEKELQHGYMGMAVDISFSHFLDKKFLRIKDEIDAYDGRDNVLGTVKYFKGKDGRRELTNIPRVIAAFDLGVMKDLVRAPDGGKGHMAQHALLQEMEHQFAVYADYAHKRNPLCLEPIQRAQHFVHVLNQHFDSADRLRSSEYRKNEKMEEAMERGLDFFRRG